MNLIHRGAHGRASRGLRAGLAAALLAACAGAHAAGAPDQALSSDDPAQVLFNASGVVATQTGPAADSGAVEGGGQVGLEWLPGAGQQVGLNLDYQHLDLNRRAFTSADNYIDASLRFYPVSFGDVELDFEGGLGYNATGSAVNGRYLAFAGPGLRWVLGSGAALDFNVDYQETSPGSTHPEGLRSTLGFSIPLDGVLLTSHQDALPPTSGYVVTPGGGLRYPPFLIGPGDLLTVNIFGNQGFPKEYLVDSDGSIYFPLVGSVNVGGLSQAQASVKLAQRLTRYIVDPRVTVMVKDSSQYTVSVMGNVVKPGKYLIRGQPTLLGALAEAGGPMPASALNRAVLIRDERAYKVNLENYFEPGAKPRKEPIILPGDVVYVPASNWPTWGEWGIIASIVSSLAILVAYVHL